MLFRSYEFGHRDDYEGRVVIPTIQLDADVRNIETITVTADETRFSPRKTEAELAEMEKKMQSDGESMEFSEYHGMMSEMYKGAVSIDDLSHYEMDLLIEKYHPDIFCAGVKEKYCVQKLGIPMKQLHNYDSGGPYASYEGCLNFYKDIEQMVCSSIWKEVKAPWEKVIATAVPHDTDAI